MRPHLVVVEAGSAVLAGVPENGSWQTTVLVRDALTTADLDVVAGSDLALLGPLPPAQADLAAAALGLGDQAGWLSRIRDDMFGIVARDPAASRPAVRWAMLSRA